jgi:hypothetical protein
MDRVTEADVLLEQARTLRELAPQLDHPVLKDDVLRLAEQCEELAQTAATSTRPEYVTATDVASSDDVTQEVSEPTHESLKNLYAYWLAKRGSRPVPSRSAIQLDAALLPDIALLDVVGAPPRFRFSFCGTRLADDYGEDLTGKFFDEIDLGSVSLKTISLLSTMVRECRPQVVRARYTKQRDGHHVEFERIALPLSEDGKTVNMILCAYAYQRQPLNAGHGDMLRPPQ